MLENNKILFRVTKMKQCLLNLPYPTLTPLSCLYMYIYGFLINIFIKYV